MTLETDQERTLGVDYRYRGASELKPSGVLSCLAFWIVELVLPFCMLNVFGTIFFPYASSHKNTDMITKKLWRSTLPSVPITGQTVFAITTNSLSRRI